MLFLLGVVGLDAAQPWEGGGAVNEDDSGLFCNGIVVPGALPFDRGFGCEEDVFGMGLPLVFGALDVVDAGGRWDDLGGDLGGEGWGLDKGEISSTSMASSSRARMEPVEGFLDLGRFAGLVLSPSSLTVLVEEAVEADFLCPFEAPLE
jgi:hypothetical protein